MIQSFPLCDNRRQSYKISMSLSPVVTMATDYLGDRNSSKGHFKLRPFAPQRATAELYPKRQQNPPYLAWRKSYEFLSDIQPILVVLNVWQVWDFLSRQRNIARTNRAYF